MNENEKRELIRACRNSNRERITELHWGDIYNTLRLGWAKRIAPPDLEPYVEMLHEFPADRIMGALLHLADTSEYHPAPAAVRHALSEDPPAPQRSSSGITRRPDNSEAAYRAVLDEVVMGASVCDCVPRSPQWTIDRHGVLWCPDCGDLEAGQYDQAMEWQNPGRPDPPAATAEDVKRWARDEQLLRLRQGKAPSPLLRKLMGGDDETIRQFAATFGLAFEQELK
jgi:hypothetical protein